MSRPDIRVAVYGDVNLNLIDGSAIWAQSVVEAFSAAGCRVSLLLKAPVQTPRLTDHIAGLAGVTVVKPFEERALPGLTNALSPKQATTILSQLDSTEPFDVLVLRGFKLAQQVAGQQRFQGRIWTYLTDVPQTLSEMDADSRERLTTVAGASQYLLCQTEELRCFLEATVPAAWGKCLLFPPVVPPVPVSRGDEPPPTHQRLRLVYTGKFAPRWQTLEMTHLPALLAGRGVTAEVHMIGDKVHRDTQRPEWHDRMQEALRRSSGTVWHGGVARQEAMRLSAAADIGLSWRDAELDSSLELSTKVLEFGALGLPVVLNRTRVHEELLGIDYPLFANSRDEVLDVLEQAAGDGEVWALAAARCQEAASAFSLPRAVDRLETYLARARPPARPGTAGARRRRVLVASHDLKFFSRILEHLRAVPDLEVRVDEWTALAAHDEQQSRELLEWADVVVCEWCGPNAIWYSQRVKPHQRLVVRLHRFELYSDYGSRVQIENVDQVVCVSPHYAQLTRGRLGWGTKVVTIPNWVDLLQFDRPKYPGARFHLGMIGIAPERKRLDLGIDVLEELRATDERYRLFVKTKMPWDYWWIWKNESERTYYRELLGRIQTSDLLRGAVVFDTFGGDVAAWLRKIGYVLSTSDDESFHLAPAEGMASRAVPVIRNWPGSDTIYRPEWIHETTHGMARAVQETSSSAGWEATRHIGHHQVATSYGLDRVCDLWDRVIHEDLPPDPGAKTETAAAGGGHG